MKRQKSPSQSQDKNGSNIATRGGGRWLLLLHQFPSKPDYFRVKIWRKLQRLGAVAIKSSVYALPNDERSNEAFQWITREIVQGKGDASICEASFVEGLEDNQIEALFNKARNSEYNKLAENARKTFKTLSTIKKITDDRREETALELNRLKKRLSEIVNVDFFGATSREATEGLVNKIESRLQGSEPGAVIIAGSSVKAEDLKGRIWVTRRGVHVDRIASAWLIQKFIDPESKFKFVEAKGYKPASGELRFDMFDAEFTHDGDLCTFEVLIARTHLNDPALKQIAEVIHEIDLRDEKYGRADTPGIESLINGICMAHKEDENRISRGSALLDDLYEYFKRKRK